MQFWFSFVFSCLSTITIGLVSKQNTVVVVTAAEPTILVSQGSSQVDNRDDDRTRNRSRSRSRSWSRRLSRDEIDGADRSVLDGHRRRGRGRNLAWIEWKDDHHGLTIRTPGDLYPFLPLSYISVSVHPSDDPTLVQRTSLKLSSIPSPTKSLWYFEYNETRKTYKIRNVGDKTYVKIKDDHPNNSNNHNNAASVVVVRALEEEAEAKFEFELIHVVTYHLSQEVSLVYICSVYNGQCLTYDHSTNTIGFVYPPTGDSIFAIEEL